MSDRATELAFIRTLSGLALHGISEEQRRERIRTEILAQNIQNQSFAFGPDQIMETFGQAFERCYGVRLEMRAVPRDALGRPKTV